MRSAKWRKGSEGVRSLLFRRSIFPDDHRSIIGDTVGAGLSGETAGPGRGWSAVAGGVQGMTGVQVKNGAGSYGDDGDGESTLSSKERLLLVTQELMWD